MDRTFQVFEFRNSDRHEPETYIVLGPRDDGWLLLYLERGYIFDITVTDDTLTKAERGRVATWRRLA